MSKKILFLCFLVSLVNCSSPKTNPASVFKESFGVTKEGKQVDRYVLVNRNGMRVEIITYGATITKIDVPDRKGAHDNVVLGFDKLSDYEERSPYFGAVVGRYGNRISDGKFSLNGIEYTLAQNNGKNHLHGGEKGFDKVVWNASSKVEHDNALVTLTYLSKDKEEGYPGNLNVEVVYTLTQDNALEVAYRATTDQTTVVNLTQHSYFNLSGGEAILDHELMLNATYYLPVDETLIPTGAFEKVENTPFDFRSFKTIGRDIENPDVQLERGLGYDHCWVLNDPNTELRLAAILKHASSGRKMEVYTTEPGIQFYSGNFLDGTLPKTNSNSFYGHRSGLCLETQHFPNSPNEPKFPSVTLSKDRIYTSKTSFKFYFSN
jgi:aldose 1-epimerase